MKHEFFKVLVHGGEAEVELKQFVSYHRIVGVERPFVTIYPRERWVRFPFSGGLP